MMMGLQDIHWSEGSLAQCMSSRSVNVQSNRFKLHDLAVTCLYSLEILT